jgi:hypothetical protein
MTAKRPPKNFAPGRLDRGMMPPLNRLIGLKCLQTIKHVHGDRIVEASNGGTCNANFLTQQRNLVAKQAQTPHFVAQASDFGDQTSQLPGNKIEIDLGHMPTVVIQES